MRTTVDLPPAAHERVRQLAASRGQSMSAVIADFTLRGLAQSQEPPATLARNPLTGLPVISVGHHVTPEEVADLLDDE